MNVHMIKIGMREFREHMPQYLKSSSPVAITRHGETIGFYIPTQHPAKSDLDDLKKAALKLDQFLRSNGLTEDEVVAEFRALREQKDNNDK